MSKMGNIALFMGLFTVMTIIWISSMIEVTILVSYHQPFTAGELMAFVTANQYETNDILGYCFRYVWPYWIICSLIYLFLCWWGWRSVHKKSRKGMWLVGLLLLVLIIPFFTPIFPHNLWGETLCMVTQLRYLKEHKNDNTGFTYRAIKTDTSKQKEIYVLSIGESLRYLNTSLNGEYERETMPKLSLQNNLYLYSNCYANATLTQHALPMLLCGVAPKHYREHYKRKTLAAAFNEVGYKTVLISHRAQLINNGYHDYLANDFDTIVYVEHDSLIVPIMRLCCETENKLFVVTHYLGNHMFYTNREDDDLIWRPDYNEDKNSTNDSIFLNAYDNSIRYIDKLLNHEIEVLKEQKGICCWLFVSDHGEYICSHVSGHGHTYHPTKEEYHIPLLVWINNEYHTNYYIKVQNMIKHKDKPICADHVFWSVLDMAGVKIRSSMIQDGMSIFGDTLLPYKRQLLLPDGKTIMNLN